MSGLCKFIRYIHVHIMYIFNGKKGIIWIVEGLMAHELGEGNKEKGNFKWYTVYVHICSLAYWLFYFDV